MKKGFSLVELLIVISIVLILSMIMIGNLNPVSLTNRGTDARRKKDLGRIKVSLEEYYNDNKCYPSGALLATLNSVSSCNTSVVGFSQLSPWPCDPGTKIPYFLTVDSSSPCPKWFKLLALLQNNKDNEIPTGWASGIKHVGDPNSVTYTNLEVNFGVSSTNINWNDEVLSVGCLGEWAQCLIKVGTNSCNGADDSGCVAVPGTRCYKGECNKPECEVSSCGNVD